MKKFLLLMAMILPMIAFTSCSDDDEEVVTTYSFTWDYKSNIEYDFTIYEYDNNNAIVAENFIPNAKQGLKKAYTANEKAVKVKVYAEFDLYGLPSKVWVQKVYGLNIGSNTDIVVTGKDKIAAAEPK